MEIIYLKVMTKQHNLQSLSMIM